MESGKERKARNEVTAVGWSQIIWSQIKDLGFVLFSKVGVEEDEFGIYSRDEWIGLLIWVGSAGGN